VLTGPANFTFYKAKTVSQTARMIVSFVYMLSIDLRITSSTSRNAGDGDIRCYLHSWISLDSLFPGFTPLVVFPMYLLLLSSSDRLLSHISL